MLNREALRRSLLFLAVVALTTAPAMAARLVSLDDVLGNIASARTVTVTAYTLSPGGPMVNALKDAVPHSRVTVELASNAFGSARTMNRETSSALRDASIGVLMSHGALHLKVALIDGAMFLSDTNWREDSLILSDQDVSDRTLVASTLRGEPGCTSHLCTQKSLSLKQEAAFIDSCRGPLFVESESFSGGNPVFYALIRHSSRGAATYLLFVGKEASLRDDEQQRMRKAHIQARSTSSTDKLAVCAGSAWVGSSNASAGKGDMVDWGYTTSDPDLVSAADTRFRLNWRGPSISNRRINGR